MENSQALATTASQEVSIPADVSAASLELAIGMGDFSRLTSADRLRYLAAVCQSVGLNPLTLPIQIMKIDGKEVLYARAECAAQLRTNRKVSLQIVDKRVDHGCYVVTVRATTPDGRTDEATGAVALLYPERVKEWVNGQSRYVPHPKAGQELEGQDWANAIKKAETQAKRRVSLSICGLGISDESDLDEVDKAKPANAKAADVITSAESAADRAAALNQAIEAEVVPPSAASEPSTPTASQSDAADLPAAQPPAEAPASPVPATDKAPSPPAPVAAPGSLTGADGLLTEDTVKNLEIVLSEHNTQNAVNFLIAKGKLKKGQPLNTVAPSWAKSILEKPKVFHNMVSDWVKSQNK